MKRIAMFIMVALICFMTWSQGGRAMPATFNETVYLPGIEAELRALSGRSIIVGPAAGDSSELAAYAAANEFGATVRPKKGKYLAVPLRPEARDRSPRDFNLEYIPPKTTGGNPILALVVKTKGAKDRVIPYYVLLKKIEIPERSWLRSTFDKRETVDKAVRIASDTMVRLLASQGKATDVLNAIGLSLVASVKSRIASNIQPSNAPLTLALKRRKSSTLVDEGRLIASIQYEVK